MTQMVSLMTVWCHPWVLAGKIGVEWVSRINKIAVHVKLDELQAEEAHVAFSHKVAANSACPARPGQWPD